MTATERGDEVSVDLTGLTGDDVVVRIDARGAEIVGRTRVLIGDTVADRLAEGLATTRGALAGVASPLASDECTRRLDGTAAWAVATFLHATGAQQAGSRFLRREADSRLRSRRTSPLPTRAARALQEDGVLSSAQVACLHELYSLGRSGNQAVAAAHRALVDDCLRLAVAAPAGADRPLAEVRTTLDTEVVLLDPALRVAVEREHARTRAGGAGPGRGVLVVVGPRSSGKRRFAQAAARALGRPLHRVRASTLATGAAVRGAPPVAQEPQRGLFAEAVVSTGCRNPIVHVDGIDRLPADDAEHLAARLADALDQPERALAGRWLPEPFAVDPRECLLVVTATDVAAVPSVLCDMAPVVELDPPTTEQRRAIVDRFLLPEIEVAVLGEVSEVVAPDVVEELVRAHAGSGGLRDLADDLRVLVVAHATSATERPVDRAWAVELLGAPLERRATHRPGSLTVPLLVGDDVVTARLDVTSVPGEVGTLVPASLDPVSAQLVRDAVDGARALRPAGVAVAGGIRVALNLQTSDAPVRAPWLSTAAVVALASLATGRPVSPVSVLAVASAAGTLDPVDRDLVDPVRLLSVLGDKVAAWAPSPIDGADVRIVASAEALLTQLGLTGGGPAPDDGAYL